MIGVGSTTDIGASIFSMSENKANASEAGPIRLVKLGNDHLAGQNLGEFAPYEPETGDLVARGYETYYSKDGDFGLGIWESKPGAQTYDELEYDELMYILDGSIVMTSATGITQTFHKGEGFVLPKGWSGTLTVPKGGVRKIWTAYMGGKKGE